MNGQLEVPGSSRAAACLRLAPLGLVLVLAASVRFYGLATNPKWYGDEGICLDIADGVARGRWEVGALRYTFFGLHHPYPPLYFLLGAPLTLILGCKLLVVRLMTASASLATVYIVYRMGRDLWSRPAGLAAALFAAVHPEFVVFSRWGFVTGLAMLFSMFTVWAGLRYHASKSVRWLAAASVGCGLALSTSYWAAPLVLWLLLLALLTRPKVALLVVSIVGLFILAVFVLSVWLNGLLAVTYDLRTTLAQFRTQTSPAGSASVAAKLQVFFSNTRAFLLLDAYTALGLASLALVPGWTRRLLVLGALACLAVPSVYLRGDIIGNFFYNALPYYPLVFVGLGVLALRAWGWLRRSTAALSVWERALPALLFLVAFGAAVLVPLAHTAEGLSRGFQTRIDVYTVQNYRDALAAADWVNGHVRDPEGEFVLASGQVGWLFRCRLATLLNSVAWRGRETTQGPSEYAHDMFLFDPSPGKASFLVADQVTYLWMVRQPGCARLLYEMDQQGWPLAYQQGEYLVFANPASYQGPQVEADPLVLRDYGVLMQETSVDMDAGRYGPAARAYGKALAHFGANPTLLSNLGVATAKAGDLDAGARYLRQALELAPAHAAARKSLEGVERDIAAQQTKSGDPANGP